MMYRINYLAYDAERDSYQPRRMVVELDEIASTILSLHNNKARDIRIYEYYGKMDA